MQHVIQQLKAAQLKARKELLATTAALQALGASHSFLGSDNTRGTRRLSLAGRAKIAKAQKARWARIRKAAKKPTLVTKKPVKKAA